MSAADSLTGRTRPASAHPAQGARPGRARLRVVRLVPEFDFGGVESGLITQAELHSRERWDLRICTFWKPGKAADAARRAGVPVDVLGSEPLMRSPKPAVALARYLARYRPDVLHSSVAEADWFASLLAPLGLARATILDAAGMPNPSWARRNIGAFFNKRVGGVIAVSRALADYQVTHEGMRRDRVRVIPNCGNGAYFGVGKTDHAVTGRPFRLAAVGRLVEVKNHEILLRALADQRLAGVELHLFGAGPLEGKLRQLASRLGLDARVHFRGFVPDLAAELKRMDAYALPSHSEGCSLALIEAMATGLPPITSDIAGNREVSGSLGAEWLVPTTDVQRWIATIERMASRSADERAEHGRRARELAHERFSPEAYVSGLESFYEDVLRAGRAPAAASTELNA